MHTFGALHPSGSFSLKGRLVSIAATAATAALPVYVISVAEEGMYIKFWALFGASNQLLAALTLLSITMWLRQARRRIGFTLWPMTFVLTLTLWAIGKLTVANLRAAQGLDIP